MCENGRVGGSSTWWRFYVSVRFAWMFAKECEPPGFLGTTCAVDSLLNVRSSRPGFHLCPWHSLGDFRGVAEVLSSLSCLLNKGVDQNFFFPSVFRIRNSSVSQDGLDQQELFLSPPLPRIAQAASHWWRLLMAFPGGEAAQWTSDTEGVLFRLRKRKEQAQTALPFKLGCRSWKRGLQEINQRKLSRIGTNKIWA